MSDAARFSTIVVAAALLVAAAVMVVVVGIDRVSPGDVAYASDPQDGLAADEAETKAAARAAIAGQVESGELVALQAHGMGLTTKAIDLPAVQSYCRTRSYNYDDCVTAHIVMDALRGDCTDCRDLGVWIFSNESGRVTHLSKTDNEFSLDFGSLKNMGLSGVIPPQIGDLAGLEKFDVRNSSLDDGPPNQLTGTIPSQIGNLTGLTWLSLSGNRLTGTIPSQIGDLTGLTWLSLSGNRLTGTIPSQIGNLTGLTSLWVYSNQLTGSIPPELGNLTSLTHLALSLNRLTGSIPSELAKLTNLEYLSIDNNQLTGCVPASLREAYEEANGDDYPICQASPPAATPAPATPGVDCGAAVPDRSNTGLVSDCEALLAARDTLRGTAALNWSPSTAIARWDGITLGGSPRRVTKILLQKRGLTGSIPAELGRLEMLEELWLYTNELTGAIPAEIGDLSNLTWLFVSGNNLGGQIPQNLNNLNLDRLWLHNNDFTGCVPYNLTLTREYKVDSGLSACAPPTGAATPTPTPVADPVAMLATHNCDADDILAIMGEGFALREEPYEIEYTVNSRGWRSAYVSRWYREESEDRGAGLFTCLTILYENSTDAAFENNHHSLRLWVEGNLDMTEAKVYDPPDIGDGFKAAGYRHGRADASWKGRIEGVARYLKGSLAVYLYTTEVVESNPGLQRAAEQVAIRRMMKAVVDMGVHLDAKYRAQEVRSDE